MSNTTSNYGTFPFGKKVLTVSQTDRTPKPVFVLGVYSSAVFAQFKQYNTDSVIRNIPIDNEPEIFWSGGQETVKKIIADIKLPKLTGKLLPETRVSNGLLGRMLDKYYLHPLKLQRDQVWICNLIPHLVTNKNNRKSIKRYNDLSSKLNLVKASIPTKKQRWDFITKKRLTEIIEEIFQSRAEVIISLGQQPLKWFFKEFDNDLGNLLSVQDYGLTTEVKIESVNFKLIPLFHPRQLLKEKNIDTRVGLLHYDWIKTKAKKIKLV